MAQFIVNRGDEVVFSRGMFGYWHGKVLRVRSTTFRRTYGNIRAQVADVAFTRRNGTHGKAVVRLTDLLIPVTETMAIDYRGGSVQFTRP